MRKAISLIGPPLSGKTTLAKKYEDHAVQIGKYVHTLPKDHLIRQECQTYWGREENFPPELTRKILSTMPAPQTNWALLDNTPATKEDLGTVLEFYDIKTIIELRAREDVWEERLREALRTGRQGRQDNTESALRKRKERFEKERLELMLGFNNYAIVDNSGSLDHAASFIERMIRESLK